MRHDSARSSVAHLWRECGRLVAPSGSATAPHLGMIRGGSPIELTGRGAIHKWSAGKTNRPWGRSCIGCTFAKGARGAVVLPRGAGLAQRFRQNSGDPPLDRSFGPALRPSHYMTWHILQAPQSGVSDGVRCMPSRLLGTPKDGHGASACGGGTSKAGT